MKSSTWLILVVGAVLAGGIALFILNQPVKSTDGRTNCGTALSHDPQYNVHMVNGHPVIPASGLGADLCAGAGDSNRTLAGIAGGTIALLAVAGAIFDYSRKRDDVDVPPPLRPAIDSGWGG